MSYYNPQTGLYRVGGDDYYLVAFYVVLFTGLRAATMEHALAPFAQSYGLSKKKDVTRFSEQAWLLTYYLVFWPLGMVCSPNTPAAVRTVREGGQYQVKEFRRLTVSSTSTTHPLTG